MQTTLDTTTRDPAAETAQARLRLTILAHPNARRIGEQAVCTAREAGLGIHRGQPGFARPGGSNRPLETRYVSRKPLFLDWGPTELRVHAGGRSCQVDGVEAGDHWVPLDRLDRGVVLRLSRHVLLLLRRESAGPLARSEDALSRLLAGTSPQVRQARDFVRRVGPTDLTVLLRGETGTGKERVAEALHQASPRARGPFIAVNLAAIPPATAASQLFGHARGAFTGAAGSSDGLFGQAEGGTLFLDEVGEAPVELQALLLRALDTGEVQRVGGPARRVNVRIIAATDADLEDLVARERFRPALLHRLAGCALHLAPLRERPEDIATLLVRFLAEELGPRAATLLGPAGGGDTPAWLAGETIQAFLGHAWPGNVRELRSAAAWVALHGADQPHAAPPPTLRRGTPVAAPAPAPSGILDAPAIQAALAETNHRIAAAAARLGVARNTLRTRMRELGIRRAVDLDDAEIAEARLRVGDDPEALAAALQVGVHALKLRLQRDGGAEE